GVPHARSAAPGLPREETRGASAIRRCVARGAHRARRAHLDGGRSARMVDVARRRPARATFERACLVSICADRRRRSLPPRTLTSGRLWPPRGLHERELIVPSGRGNYG